MQTTLYKEVLATFDDIEIFIAIDKETDYDDYSFDVVLVAHRNGEEFGFDDLGAQTIEEAYAIVASSKARLSQDDLYEFSKGESRDWLY